MSDTWTLNKKCEDLEKDIEDLQKIAHEPVFTKEMLKAIHNRIVIIEEALGLNEEKKGSKKKKASA